MQPFIHNQHIIVLCEIGGRYESGECPVIYLKHEVYYGDVCELDEMKIKATDTFDLLKCILNEPLKYVASYWIGGDHSEQWFPESVSFS